MPSSLCIRDDARADADQVTAGRLDGEKVEWRPLCSACGKGHPQCVQLLLSKGISRKTMEIALADATKNEHHECARLVRLARRYPQQLDARFTATVQGAFRSD